MSKTLLPLLLLAILLQSCATPGAETKADAAPVIVDNGCAWAKPIYVSKADVLTDGTADAILAHNVIGARLCGWRSSSRK